MSLIARPLGKPFKYIIFLSVLHMKLRSKSILCHRIDFLCTLERCCRRNLVLRLFHLVKEPGYRVVCGRCTISRNFELLRRRLEGFHSLFCVMKAFFANTYEFSLIILYGKEPTEPSVFCFSCLVGKHVVVKFTITLKHFSYILELLLYIKLNKLNYLGREHLSGVSSFDTIPRFIFITDT